MAQQIVTLLTDDIDGGEADETVVFGLDGKTFEIDLTDKNAAKLRKALAPYVAGGRKQPKTGGAPSARKRSASPAGAGDTAEIRAWAKANGYSVNDRGRVPAEIREAFEKSQG
ncbi:histone-like nucleoid-structuring protein Lsr2 [Streptomyces sp. H27-H5]|uniref:histone-like nucleoid-structuring protein Lsr2 n=1 Tax=Streptomyces sp. H27-H5 TaxID=2996460 RepID=UPI00226FEDDB|nr:Lsr2 family protein [Streptomyces sp. H27-H5]MCY0955819.1 Lsr2 family protein [Streptomyces sp. H27-H5]